VISQFQEYRQGRGRRKESFIDLNDLSLLPTSTEVITSPQIVQASKVSSVDCGHVSCNLGIAFSTENDMSKMKNYKEFLIKTDIFFTVPKIFHNNGENIDEIIMWNEQETYNE
jgi:hypothetical protein